MLPIFTFQAALCALVVLEAHSDVMTIDRRVCDYVTFDLDYPQLEQPFQISWHKTSTPLQISTPLLSWTPNNTRHGQHIRVFPNGTLSLHVVGKEDAGWYVAMVCKSPQPCLRERKFQLRVHEQNEMFRGNTVCILINIPVVSLGVLIMTALVVLICHFQKCKNRSDEGDNPEEYEEVYENSPCSQNDETPSVQGLDYSVEFVLRNKGSQSSNQESDPATADKMEKDPSYQGSKV